MKSIQRAIALALLVPSFAFAELKLDSAEVLIQKASESRQGLHEAILNMQYQMPEMRDIKTYESYFFLCDELSVQAVRHDLDDIYPNGVQSLCQSLASFGVKWLDLSTIDKNKLEYYVKWMDVEALANLSSYSDYLSKKITEPELLKALADNVEFALNQAQRTLKDRFDIELSYRELISSIAIKFLLNAEISAEDKALWAKKIYTSQGLNLFTDLIQNQLYVANNENSSVLHEVYANLEIASMIADRLLDAPMSQTKDRVNYLIVEALKRSIELGVQFEEGQVAKAISKLEPKHLQSLAGLLTSSSEVLASKHPKNFVAVGKTLLPALTQFGLTTEVFYLNSIISKVYTSLTLETYGAEGTYEFTDTEGQAWRLSIVRPKPFEVLVAVGNKSMSVVKTYNSLQFDPIEGVLVAKRSELDPSIAQSLLILQFADNGSLTIRDSFSLTYRDFVNAKHIEKVPSFNFKKIRPGSFNKVFSGEIAFDGLSYKSKVELVIQTDGVNATAQIRDKYGIVYEFREGFISASNEVVLTTGKLKELGWVQLRGTLTDTGISAQLISGGHGFITKEFNLKGK